jgi:hypothetical protein
LKKASSIDLMNALKEQLPELTQREPKFIPTPARWLSKGSWMNESTIARDPEVDRVANLRKLRASGEYDDRTLQAMCADEPGVWEEVVQDA